MLAPRRDTRTTGGERHVIEDARIIAAQRLRQLLRVLVVLATGLVVAATGLAIWWLTSLNGLPDIGDPFDVAAFRAFPHPGGTGCLRPLSASERKKLTPRGLTDLQGNPVNVDTTPGKEGFASLNPGAIGFRGDHEHVQFNPVPGFA